VIVLVGFMGAGKTTVGRLLAGQLGLPFLDADAVIEERAGCRVPQIFADRGEPGFRALEHETIAGLLGGPDAVLALGGGAVEHAGTRRLLLAANVVYLHVPFAGAMARVGGDAGRPMLARPGLADLYQRRLAAYEAVATHTVPTDGRQPADVCRDIARALGVNVPLSGFSRTEGAGMRIGMSLNYAGGFAETVTELADYEKAGLGIVFVPEAYSYDAVSQLGYIAAKTERLQIASGIFQLYSRTPALTAMTAAGLDYVSNGRFTLGIGASGPQVIEGWHGVPYDAPVGRTRELIEICRMVWRRERLSYDGRYYQLPLPPDRGTGLGKPLKLINHPVRERIPIMVAAVGPKNVALAAELADGWQPFFYLPEKAAEVWGGPLAEGLAKRALGPLDVVAQAPLMIGNDVTAYRDLARPFLALYIGGMGARGKNFYNTLARRLGYEAEAEQIQDAYLDGRKEEAAALVPADLLELTSLIGPEGYVRERLAAFREAGATTLTVTPLAPAHADRVRLIEQAATLAA